MGSDLGVFMLGCFIWDFLFVVYLWFGFASML